MANSQQNQSKDNSAIITGGVSSGATAAGIGIAAAGSSASTITWALGTIGGAVGGGMAAGLAVVAAAPLAVGAVGYGAVKLQNSEHHHPVSRQKIQ